MRTATTGGLRALVSELLEVHRVDEQEKKLYLRTAMRFVRDYADGCELPGDVVLVVDNSIIQDFKHSSSWELRSPEHRTRYRKRLLRSLSFATFCDFVSSWSGRTAIIGISPVALYEHFGRSVPASPDLIPAAMVELSAAFARLRLPISRLDTCGFETAWQTLQCVDNDAEVLAAQVREVEQTDWAFDLRRPLGVAVPYGLAQAATQHEIPVNYFDPWYVRLALRGRIERRIIERSPHPRAHAIGTGVLSEVLDRLITLNKAGGITGLGDLDLLQLCDVQRQFKHENAQVFLGQTVDDDLAKVLRLRQCYNVGASVVVGDPEMKGQVDAAVRLLLSKPFADYEKRGDDMRSKAAAFRNLLLTLCR